MTAREMFIGFMNQLYTINPEFETSEVIDSTMAMYYINLAQYRYLNEKYLGSSVVENVSTLNKNIEDIKKLVRRKTLFAQLVYSSEIYNVSPVPINHADYIDTSYFPDNNINILGTMDRGVSLPLPTDYFYYINSTSYVSVGDTIVSNIPAVNPTVLVNKLINSTEFNPSILTNVNNKPIIRNPIVSLEVGYPLNSVDNKLVIYLDSYTTLYNVEYTYIKKPTEISLGSYLEGSTQDCELSESTHKDIVEKAVKIFIEENKYKLSSNQAR